MQRQADSICGGIRHTVLLLTALLFAASATAETRIDAYAMGDLMHNADGGIRTGSVLLIDAGLEVASDLDDLIGNIDAKLFAYLLWNNSTTFSNRYVGDAQVVSSIDAGQALRVYEFWYEQQLNDDVSMRIGLYDLNAEFDVIDTAGLFVNSSHGIGAEYAQSGRAGPSIFPLTSLAARFDMALTETSVLRYAVLDGVPGDPADPSRTTIRLGGDDGLLHALEFNYENSRGSRFGVGGWLYSADFDRLEPAGADTRDDGNGGLYAFVDAPVYRSESGIEANAFLRYGAADDELNAFDSYVGAGLVATGLIPARPGDRIGIAVASARTGDPFRRAAGAVDSHETSIELTYSAQITDWLRLQPDIQYVINPGADPALKDALVLGLRFELTTSHAIPHHGGR